MSRSRVRIPSRALKASDQPKLERRQGRLLAQRSYTSHRRPGRATRNGDRCRQRQVPGQCARPDRRRYGTPGVATLTRPHCSVHPQRELRWVGPPPVFRQLVPRQHAEGGAGAVGVVLGPPVGNEDLGVGYMPTPSLGTGCALPAPTPLGRRRPHRRPAERRWVRSDQAGAAAGPAPGAPASLPAAPSWRRWSTSLWTRSHRRARTQRPRRPRHGPHARVLGPRRSWLASRSVAR